ncbi:MAG: hypothetical protein KGZ37_00515 [Nitrosarchaeum sp.]|nr:hypothetical protein [Nitrosarchaeum sp.]
MEIITNIVKQDMCIDYDLKVTGIIIGNTIIENNGVLILSGIGNGTLTINHTGKCEMYGIFNGIIENNGRTLNIYGIVNGSIIKNSGQTKIDPNAIIKLE